MTSLTLRRVTDLLRDRGLLLEVHGSGDVEVRGVSQDSRTVSPGDLFLAWKGVDADAHAYLADAVGAGAVAAVVERHVEDVDVPQLVVRDGRLAAALAADAVLGSPWRSLRMVAVTGTNGKTTTTLLLRHVLSLDGPAAALGTLGLVNAEGRSRPGGGGLTTPGPVQLIGWLRKLEREGMRAVVMEASSHALAQRRLDALRFDCAVFTNLGLDHLDYHVDVEGYRAAKLRLAELLREDGTAVVNADDPAWNALPPVPNRITWALDAEHADLRAMAVEPGTTGSRFTMTFRGEERRVRLPLAGRFNVQNALAASGAALALGVPMERVVDALAEAPQVPGRLERVVEHPFPVLIDFAHTPDALEGVLGALRPLVTRRLIVVFGAGGDRDRSKRRPMAEAVARHADLAVLTSDNPRTEDPERILDDLEPGLAGCRYERIGDRRTAIHRALEVAGAGDLVLLAGKGHERYQVVGAERTPLDEREIVREALG